MVDIRDFLIKAKKNTYANGKALKMQASRLLSKDYQYEEKIGDKTFIYHDTYFGGERFIGEEVVYIDGGPVWAMNYHGVVLKKDLSEEFIDNALRPALMKVGEDKKVLPLRGPSEFNYGDLKYIFENVGDMEYFSGVEKIYCGEELIYELYCNGGTIK